MSEIETLNFNVKSYTYLIDYFYIHTYEQSNYEHLDCEHLEIICMKNIKKFTQKNNIITLYYESDDELFVINLVFSDLDIMYDMIPKLFEYNMEFLKVA